jgi:hypothetical protein
MEKKIAARVAELRQAERDAETRLVVIRNLIVELETLIAPAPIYSGDALDEPTTLAQALDAPQRTIEE